MTTESDSSLASSCLGARPSSSSLREIATSWIGTPFRANAAVKGPRGGVSCQTLIAAILKEAGLVPADLHIPEGPMGWADLRRESLLVPWFERCPYFEEVAFDLPPPENYPRLNGCTLVQAAQLQPGDVLGIHIRHTIHHLMLHVGDGDLIHAWRPDGVLWANIGDATVLNRWRKTWRCGAQ
jgi:cell wall-associated NlpC family hydrolase